MPIIKYDGSLESRKELYEALAKVKEEFGEINALAIMRLQTVHNGHIKLVNFAESISDKFILGMGSCQVERRPADPFAPAEKMEMIRLAKGYDKKNPKKLSVVKLNDQGAIYLDAWRGYVYSTIAKYENLPLPNVYIGGSVLDIKANGFGDDEMLCISLERNASGMMSATDIRKSIVIGDDEWKLHVPFSLHDYIEKTFPRELYLEAQVENKI